MPVLDNASDSSVRPDRHAAKPVTAALHGAILRLSEAQPSVEQPRLWFGLYSGKLTLLNGESGAGKSSFFRLLCLHAALNKTLWNISFGLRRPLNVLYVDPENLGDASRRDGGLTALRMDALGLGRPANLFLMGGTLPNGDPLNLSDPSQLRDLEEFIRENHIDLVVLDPYAIIFRVENENDNAATTRIIMPLKALAQRTNCAVLLCHHIGKIGEENQASAKYGRGASALYAAVDVVISFRPRSPQTGSDNDDDGVPGGGERRDYIRGKVEKIRVGNANSAVYLQMEGEGRFRRVTKEEFDKCGKVGGREAKREGQEEEARRTFQDILRDFEEHDRSALVGAAKAKGISEKNAMLTLENLIEDKEVVVRRVQRGKLRYRLVKGNPHYFAASATPDGPEYIGAWTPRPKLDVTDDGG